MPTEEEVKLQRELSARLAFKMANTILDAAREVAGNPTTNAMVILEMVGLHVIIMAVSHEGYEPAIDDLAKLMKKHIQVVHKAAVDDGVIDEPRPN